MTGKLNSIELRRANLVPSSVFPSPDAVLAAEALSPGEMLRILRRWEFDLRRPLQPLPTEQMQMLRRVRQALAQLRLRASSPAIAPTARH